MSENSNTGPIIPADFLIDGQIDVQLGSAYQVGASTLSGLADVDITSPTTGQLLTYTGSGWANAAPASIALADLTDMSLATPSSGQILLYNGTQWSNVDLPTPTTELEELSDVNITSPSDGQVLTYDAANDEWKNSDVGGGTSDYQDLDNKPQINGITLSGNKTAEDLNLTWVGTQAQYDAIVSKNPAVLYFITDGAQNSKGWTDIIGTLTAGSTEITFTSTVITTDSTIDVYTEVFGVSPTNMTVVTGGATLTFKAQSSNMRVKIRVS